MGEKLRTIRVINGNGPAEMSLQEVMARKQFFQKHGLQPEYLNVPDGVTGLNALLEGRGDACLQLGFGPALAAIEKGSPLRVIAGANLRAVHVVFSCRKEVKSVKDLEGRTVGIGKEGALTHQLMTAIIRKSGGDPKKVRFVTVGNSHQVFQAVVAGKVEGGLGEIDHVPHQEKLGVHALPDGNLWTELPNFTNQASFATLAAITEKRDLLVRALAASAELYRFVSAPGTWEEFLAARLAGVPGSDVSEARAQWTFYQERHPFAENLVIGEDRLSYMQEINVAMGLQTRVLDYSAVADMSLAQEALESLGSV